MDSLKIPAVLIYYYGESFQMLVKGTRKDWINGNLYCVYKRESSTL